MTDETESAPPRARNKVQVVLVALMVLLLVGTQALSYRPRFLTDRPQVVKVADISDANLAAMQERVNHGKAFPNDRYAPPVGLRVVPDPTKPFSRPAIGYSFRELAMLGMPLFAYKDKGLVIYSQNEISFVTAPLSDDDLKLLGDADGPAARNYVFPVWEYLWGWALFVLVAAWGYVWWRSDRKRRAESGLL